MRGYELLIATIMGTPVLARAQAPPDSWIESQSISEMDGVTTYGLYIDAMDSIGQSPRTLPSLVILCSPDKRKPYVNVRIGQVIEARWNQPWGWRATFRAKIDVGEPKKADWYVARNLIGALSSPFADPKFVTRLAGGHILRLEVPLHSQGNQVIKFPMTGLATRLPAFAARCGWKP